MQIKQCDPLFVCHPTVCAVGNEYQIIVPVNCDMLFCVDVGGKTYYDDSNGIMRSDTRLHKVSVPVTALDTAKEYTVCYRKITNRRPYYTESDDVKRVTYAFKPLLKTENIKIYQLADTHGMIEPSVKAAHYFGDELDLLILNGDIADHSGSLDNISIAFRIASAVTGGELPVVFSRGNHDLRGACAEKLEQYMPNGNGNSYYTFRIGAIFGILVDCGEDKEDSHGEYGNTVCCEAFRERETRFIEQTLEKAEFTAPDIKYRLVISHVPFTYNNTETDSHGDRPFNIEVERYTYWSRLLKEKYKPHLMLCGHLHLLSVSEEGGEYDSKGQPCTVIIGSKPDRQNLHFTGTALTLSSGFANVKFTDDNKNVVAEKNIKTGGEK